MKIIVSKTALEMAVKNICRVINTKNALPILGDVLCMVDEQRQTITMTGSDTEAWLTYQLALLGCEGGGRFGIEGGSVPGDRNFLTALNYYTDLLTLNQQREDRVPDHIDQMFQERYGYHFNRD